jgi:hypothetical protein
MCKNIFITCLAICGGKINIVPFLFLFFIISWGGVRLSPLGTLATNGAKEPALDDE